MITIQNFNPQPGTITFQHNGHVYMVIEEQTGRLLEIDWDFIEGLVRSHQENIYKDNATVFAFIARAVRDFILEVKIPALKKEKKC